MSIKKPLLILERHDFIPESKEAMPDGSLTLTGNFAIFDLKNENNRIYEKQEYIPHLPYLQEKAKRKKLFGEVDHPDRFDVMVSKVSHIVESLWLDEKTNTIKGKIKLLNTSAGKDARAIIEGGGVLSISSRAAGTVNESTRKVSIKRIFTYDLVGDGGFGTHAELTRVNEKLGIMNENVSIYEVPDNFMDKIVNSEVKQELNEILLELNSDNKEFKRGKILSESKTVENKYINYKKNNESKMNNNKKVVTHSQMQAYSEMISEKFNSLEKNIKNLKTVPKGETNDLKQIQRQLGQFKTKINSLVESSNLEIQENAQISQFLDYLAETVNKVIGFTDYLSKEVGKDVSEIKESLRLHESFMDYTANKVNEGLNHNNHLAERINVMASHSDHIVEHQNTMIQHTDSFVDYVNKISGFVEYLRENVQHGFDFANYLGTTQNNALQFSEYQGKIIEALIQYVDYTVKNTLPSLPKAVNEGSSRRRNLNAVEKAENVNEKIQGFLNTIEKQKMVNENLSNVRNLLSPANARRFNALNEADKQKVIQAVNEKGAVNEKEVLRVWDNALSNPVDTKFNKVLEHIPSSLKDTWQSITEAQRNMIKEKALRWDLSNPAKARQFWMTSGLSQLAESANDYFLNESNRFNGSPIQNTALAILKRGR